MTIITESLISECLSQKTFCINSVVNSAIDKTVCDANNYSIEFSIDNTDIRKLLITNLVIEFCEFKKTHKDLNLLFYIKEEEYNSEIFNFISEILTKMEIFKKEKSDSFFKSFIKFLKRNEMTYLYNIYLKQATNKLALIR